MSGMRHPEFGYFLEAFALMRRFAPIYLVAAAVLLFVARPELAAIGIAGISGVACGALQLLSAHFGRKALYGILFLTMVFGLAGLVYFRIGPFDTTGLQTAALAALAVALQRAVCAYLHKFAFGGLSFRLGE
jgi:hypothetical protein